MRFYKCSSLVLAAFLLFVTQPAEIFAQERLPNFVEIEFPIGDVEVRLVESSRGMILVITSARITMRARRVYFGDGENSVKYEATNFGIETPAGVDKKGGFDIDDGATIEVESAKLKKWGSNSNEIYIKVPNLKFETQSE